MAAITQGITAEMVAAVMAQSLDAIVTKTRQGMITGWSPVAVDMYGYPPEEIIGRDSSILLPAGWESEEADLLRRAAAGERVAPYSTNRVRKDGTIIAVLLGMSAIVDGAGTVVGVASTSRPLSVGTTPGADVHVPQEDRERLRAQLEQAQRLEGLGQLAGGVAHDFNNLIGVILNYAEFVGDEIDAAAGVDGNPRWKAAAQDIGQIRRAAERAAGLTRQLLSFARREVIQPQVIDLNELLDNMASILRRTLGANLELVTDLAEGLPPVLADPGQIDQLILNLAVNARDAMPDVGRLTITTDRFHVDRAYAAEWSSVLPGDYVRVTVADTGTGMTAEVIKHAFEPFYTTKNKGEGSGLGLATVYGAVTQADGHIRISSLPGDGTTFTILLPVTNRSVAEAVRATPSRRIPGSHTALIVEDEDALREVTRRLLTRQGYTVITAANGAEAITAADSYQGTIDLLITDVIMPQMLGREAAEKIQRTRPDIRVLYMSGYAQPFLASQGRLDPGVTLLDKPFTERELLDKVDAVLAPQTVGQTA
ncbi:ATP-binding protein [Actinoplanes sp. ATCC 53533]|uniref:ATP-binding protein n=1 Tax=Actinoplanes sp. ATCC 53533 TaxID=1288362 RepID=UPI0013155CDD|nr:ATP-binding protein [Actinoplanes sp. ATCC 53533]